MSEPPASHPEVVAHRGASADAPEHTLAAFRDATRIGADAVECDVRMTRDGVLVCVHDRRIHRTSNGRGVVSALHLSELESFHFGVGGTGKRRWRARSGPVLGDEPDEERGMVLTLDRLLAFATATPGAVRLAIETKHPTRHTGRVELALVASLRRHGLVDRDGRPAEWGGKPAVRVMSFSQLALRRMRELTPGVPTVQLVGKRLRTVRRDLLAGSMTAVGPSVGLLRADPEYVADAHAAGKEVHVWTVNDGRDMEFVRSLGVDAVITDRPRELLRRLGRGRPGHGARSA